MNSEYILDKIVDTYRSNFDVEEPYEFHGEVMMPMPDSA